MPNKKVNKISNGVKNNCKRYAQAITDSVLGEAIDVPKEELMGHLKECVKCRQEATNWQDFQNALRVKEYHARPEVKEKWDRFIKELTGSAPARPEATVGIKLIQGKPVLDNETEIGTPAGAVWRYLAKNGWVKVNDLTRDLSRTDKIDPDETKFAVGWLACQNKIYQTRVKQTKYVYLTEPERQIYQQEQAQV